MPLRYPGLVLAVLLTACSSAPVQRKTRPATPPPVRQLPDVKPSSPAADAPGGLLPGDGPPADSVVVDSLPEPVPVDEPELPRANQPYTVQGELVTPERGRRAYSARGVASWYGKRFHGRKTASGERYDMYAFSAAHRTLPIPSYARVTNLKNGKSIVVRVNDRGPFHKKRLIDLSWAAASRLDFIKQGEASVLVERVLPGEAELRPDNAEPLAAGSAGSAGSDSTTGSGNTGIEAGRTYVQAASFRNTATAQHLISRLRRELGSDVTVTLAQAGEYWRVLVGPYASDDEARGAAGRVQDITGQGTLLYRAPALVAQDEGDSGAR